MNRTPYSAGIYWRDNFGGGGGIFTPYIAQTQRGKTRRVAEAEMTCQNGQKFVIFRREVHELPGRISRNYRQLFEY